jgi:hypothetical protein
VRGDWPISIYVGHQDSSFWLFHSVCALITV